MLVVDSCVPTYAIIAFIVLTLDQYDINIAPTDIKYRYTIIRCFVHNINVHIAAIHPEKVNIFYQIWLLVLEFYLNLGIFKGQNENIDLTLYINH